MLIICICWIDNNYFKIGQTRFTILVLELLEIGLLKRNNFVYSQPILFLRQIDRKQILWKQILWKQILPKVY